MDFHQLFKKNVKIKIINFKKDYLFIFINLNPLFNFLLKIYDSIELFIDYDLNNEVDFNNIFLNFKNNLEYNHNKLKIYTLNNLTNNIFNNNNSSVLSKIIDLNSINYIEDIYNNIFGIPFSIYHLYQNINRIDLIEDKVYNNHLNKFNNFSYIFSSSYYHSNESDYPIFIYKYNFYNSNDTYYNFWYKSEEEFYFFGKVIENCEELYLNIEDQNWIEFTMILNLSKIKKKVIYYSSHIDEHNIILLNKRFPKLSDWIFIRI